MLKHSCLCFVYTGAAGLCFLSYSLCCFILSLLFSGLVLLSKKIVALQSLLGLTHPLVSSWKKNVGNVIELKKKEIFLNREKKTTTQ